MTFSPSESSPGKRKAKATPQARLAFDLILQKSAILQVSSTLKKIGIWRDVTKKY